MQQRVLASNEREGQNSGYFIMRDKSQTPAYLVVQHWEFCCLCTAGEGAFGCVARVGTNKWDVFKWMRRKNGIS